MPANDFLIDTNILIYHTHGLRATVDFISSLVDTHTFNISILTKIEFLGWDRHTPEGFDKCERLIKSANIYPVDDDIANKAIDLKRKSHIKLADAVIAATALLNNLTLATRNMDDFRLIQGLGVINPLSELAP